MKKFLLSALCAVATLAGFAAETVGQGTAESPYTVADVIALNNPGTTSWVKGYIVGCYNWVNNENKFSDTELSTSTNIAIAPTASGYDPEKDVIAIQLKRDSEAYNALNVMDTPGNIGKEVAVCGTLTKYIVNCGVKSLTAYVLDGQAPDPVDPDPVVTTGKGTETEPYTVADVIALNNPGSEAWVTGYVVGAMNTSGTENIFETSEFTAVANVFIAATADETDQAKMVPVQLSVSPAANAAVRAALNLKDNPDNFGKQVSVYGKLEKYFSKPGVKGTSEVKIDGGSIDTPQVPTEGPGSKDQPYTVAEAIALNNNASLGWVSGYIVGVMNYNSADKKNDFSSTELITNSNLVIAATPTETDKTKMMAIQLPSGSKVRSDLNLVDRPGNLGKEVSVCGSFESYCGTNGVKETSDYTIIGGLAPVEIGEVESLTAFIEDQPATNVKIAGAVTVFYQSPDKKYTFITDGTSNIEVFGALANEYKNGDVLTGIVGKFSTYNNMPQLEPQADSFGAATAGAAVDPEAATLDQVKPADYVLISNVDIVADGTKFNVTDGTTTLQLFNRFNIEGIEAAEGVTILGIGSVFGENKQIFPIAINPEQSGISEINAGNGAAVIYDLQGRRLSAPVKGINIINGRKVLVK